MMDLQFDLVGMEDKQVFVKQSGSAEMVVGLVAVVKVESTVEPMAVDTLNMHERAVPD